MEKKELDETVERARVALANANWDESKHQRGAGGRFVKGGGGESSAKDEPKEYELDETASKYGLKPGAIVGLKLMDGGKRNYRITEVLEDGSYRVEQADKPGCNMERVKPSAVTVKRPVSKAKEKPAGKGVIDLAKLTQEDANKLGYEKLDSLLDEWHKKHSDGEVYARVREMMAKIPGNPEKIASTIKPEEKKELMGVANKLGIRPENIKRKEDWEALRWVMNLGKGGSK